MKLIFIRISRVVHPQEMLCRARGCKMGIDLAKILL